jgi:hypothetical protein
MYIRFAVTQRDEDSGCSMGVFMAACELRDSIDTHPDLVARVRSAKAWFNDNLAEPQDSGKEVEPRAIFWFRSQAGECIRRVWDLVKLLDEGGCLARQLTCTRPGKIVYEDEHQVAAIPFRDTRRRL